MPSQRRANEFVVTAAIINNQPALINSGKTRFQGFEVAGDLQLPHAVFARATYSFHDGKFVDFVQDFDGTLTQLAGIGYLAGGLLFGIAAVAIGKHKAVTVSMNGDSMVS